MSSFSPALSSRKLSSCPTLTEYYPRRARSAERSFFLPGLSTDDFAPTYSIMSAEGTQGSSTANATTHAAANGHSSRSGAGAGDGVGGGGGLGGGTDEVSGLPTDPLDLSPQASTVLLRLLVQSGRLWKGNDSPPGFADASSTDGAGSGGSGSGSSNGSDSRSGGSGSSGGGGGGGGGGGSSAGDGASVGWRYGDWEMWDLTATCVRSVAAHHFTPSTASSVNGSISGGVSGGVSGTGSATGGDGACEALSLIVEAYLHLSPAMASTTTTSTTTPKAKAKVTGASKDASGADPDAGDGDGKTDGVGTYLSSSWWRSMPVSLKFNSV